MGAVVGVATGVYQDYSALGSLYHAPKFEVEADYVGTYLAARAGYDVGCVSSFWSKMIAKNPGAAWAESLTHPDGSSRLHVLDATAAEIHHKRENGRALVPNLKSTLEASDPVDVEAFLASTDCGTVPAAQAESAPEPVAVKAETTSLTDLQIAGCQGIAAAHVMAVESAQKALEVIDPSEAQCTMWRSQHTFCTSALEHCSAEEQSECAAWVDLVAEHCDG